MDASLVVVVAAAAAAVAVAVVVVPISSPWPAEHRTSLVRTDDC